MRASIHTLWAFHNKINQNVSRSLEFSWFLLIKIVCVCVYFSVIVLFMKYISTKSLSLPIFCVLFIIRIGENHTFPRLLSMYLSFFNLFVFLQLLSRSASDEIEVVVFQTVRLDCGVICWYYLYEQSMTFERIYL